MAANITLELLAGARNLIKYAKVKKAMEVAIVVSQSQDEGLINALVIAAEELGAHVVVIKARGRYERLDFPGLFEEPGRIVQKALLGADIIIDAGMGGLYGTGGRPMDRRYLKSARGEYGAFYIRSEVLTPEVMASEFGRFPCDLIYAIGKRVIERLDQAKNHVVRITSPLGTDIQYEYDPAGLMGSYRELNMPGDMLAIPGGRVGLNPQHGFGILYAEMISPKVEPPHMFMKKPLKIVWEDNWATEITGECSDWLNETLDKADKNSRWWGESMFGIHPKSKPWGYPYGHMEVYYTGTHSRPDTLHNALGHSSGHGGVVSKVHIDVFIHNQTFYCDGEKLIDAGHLTVYDEPEIRAIAAKYGDPDAILNLEPMPEGFFICEEDKNGK